MAKAKLQPKNPKRAAAAHHEVKAAPGANISKQGAMPAPAPKVSAGKNAATSRQQPQFSSASQIRQPLPAKSIAKAKSHFANFTLSKFKGLPAPHTHVPSGQHPASTQQKVITTQLNNLTQLPPLSRAITVVLPAGQDVKQLMPSFDAKKGTVNLNDFMSLIQKNLNGTEFYSKGNPTLNRINTHAKVDQIMKNVKGGRK